RPSTPSVKLMTLITATMPMIVRTCARSARPSTGRWNRKAVCGLIPPANGTLNVPTFTPLKTGIATATTWPASLRPAFSSKTSSELGLGGIPKNAEPPRLDEGPVDGAQAAAEQRVHRRPQRDRLAVHRPAGAHHEVGVGDQALHVDCVVGDDETSLLAARCSLLERGPLARAARDHHRLQARFGGKALDHRPIERVTRVVGRGLGRRADHD